MLCVETMAWRKHSSTRGLLRQLGTSLVILLMFDIAYQSLKREYNWEFFIGQLPKIELADFDSLLLPLC